MNRILYDCLDLAYQMTLSPPPPPPLLLEIPKYLYVCNVYNIKHSLHKKWGEAKKTCQHLV